MALAPKKVCNHPGCYRASPDSYCDQHKKQARKREYRGNTYRGNTTERGYGHDWQKLRARKIRANPLCEECEKHGRVRVAQDVDHIVPFTSVNDPLRLDWNNLRCLCRPCHNKIGKSRPAS